MTFIQDFWRNIKFLKALRWKKDFVRSLLESENLEFLQFAPPGHFYSPLPDLPDVHSNANRIFNENPQDLLAINLNVESQIQLVESFSRIYKEVPFQDHKSASVRYFLDNKFFSYGDGIILYSFLRYFQPKRVVEVGSGFSSAAMLDINDLFLDKRLEFTFIEPFPDRLFGLLSSDDRQKSRIEVKRVQEVEDRVFTSLEANDILFVDSSHVAKIDSDVVHIIFQILPRLQKGVIVHFHDIPWPFEYPKQWVDEGRAWNEAYFLRAFLQDNVNFEIVYFNSFMANRHADLLSKAMPRVLNTPTSPVTLGNSSLWLRKVN